MSGDEAVLTRLRERRRPLSDERLLPHQQEALCRAVAMLNRFRGCLLADDIGLGKSYVAAAVASHFAERRFAVGFVVPAALVVQWKGVIGEFELDATVVTHDGLLRAATFPDPAGRRLLVIDEAHRFRNRATQRYGALARLAVGAHLLLVTATPFCNSKRDLLSIVDLFAADDAFAECGVPSLAALLGDDRPERLDDLLRLLMIRREAAACEVELPRAAARNARYELCGAAELEPLVASLEFPLLPSTAARLMRPFLWRRLSSSVAAMRQSAERYRRFLARALESAAEGRLLRKRDYQRIFGRDEDALFFQDVLFPSLWSVTEANVDVEALRAELDVVARLVGELENVRDTKAELLARELAFTEALPALVFTESIATARSLFGQLATFERRALLTSQVSRIGKSLATAEQVVMEFRRGALDLLISTDCGAEGLNLQVARSVVQYDLPWTPVKLDQRAGRAIRIGSAHAEVAIVYFVPERRQHRLLTLLARKDRERRRFVRSTLPSERIEAREGAGAVAARGSSDLAVARLDPVLGLFAMVSGERLSVTTRPELFLPDDVEVIGAADGTTARDVDEALRRKFQARAAVPAFLPSSIAQNRFLSAHATQVSASLLELLGERYPAGVEITIGEVAGEYVDREKVRFLEEMLRSTRRQRETFDGELLLIVQRRS